MFALTLPLRAGAGVKLSSTSPTHVEPPVELFELVLNGTCSLRAYGDPGFAALPPLPNVAPAALRSLGLAVPIGEAHSRGLLHRGVWIFVLDSRRRVLMLRRSPSTVTCPSAWSLVGEHSERAEPWAATARRALVEELGVPSAIVASIEVVQLGAPVLFSCDYAREGGWLTGGPKSKRDLQATALLAVTLSAGVERELTFDEDVADHRWLSLSALTRLAFSHEAHAAHAELQFCNPRIRTLLRLAITRLEAASARSDGADVSFRSVAGSSRPR